MSSCLSQVEWVDNQACVDVIEAMPPKGLGVLAVLNDQCNFPDGSDATFMNALKWVTDIHAWQHLLGGFWSRL